MAEFDPFAFLSWFVPMVLSGTFGIFAFVMKSSWSKGNLQAKTEDVAKLNQTMITNAIREIEVIKSDLKNLLTELHEQKISSTRVDEKVKHMTDTLDLLRSDIHGLTDKLTASENRVTAAIRNRVRVMRSTTAEEKYDDNIIDNSDNDNNNR